MRSLCHVKRQGINRSAEKELISWMIQARPSESEGKNCACIGY